MKTKLVTAAGTLSEIIITATHGNATHTPCLRTAARIRLALMACLCTVSGNAATVQCPEVAAMIAAALTTTHHTRTHT